MEVKVKGKVIGEMDAQRKIFAKRVSKSKHLFRKLDAWGIDGNFFRNTLLPGNYTIKIFETDEMRVYETDANTFDEHGVWMHFKNEKADHGPQAFLARQYWK